MIWIAWIVLALYALPLFGIFASVVVSSGYTKESIVVYIVGSMAIEFLQNLRDAFGSLIVPLLTAFAVRPVGTGDRVPAQTMGIFAALAILFLASVTSVGLVQAYHEGIAHHDPKVLDAFQSITRSYAKEFLSFIALTLGVSLKRG